MFIGELGAILEIKSKKWDLLQIASAEIPAGISNSSCRLEFVETTKTFQQVKLSWLWLCLGQNLGNYWSFPRLIAKTRGCKTHMKHNCKQGHTLAQMCLTQEENPNPVKTLNLSLPLTIPV